MNDEPMTCCVCHMPIDPSASYHVRFEGTPDEVSYCWDCGCKLCQKEQAEAHPTMSTYRSAEYYENLAKDLRKMLANGDNSQPIVCAPPKPLGKLEYARYKCEKCKEFKVVSEGYPNIILYNMRRYWVCDKCAKEFEKWIGNGMGDD